jgi:fibronectin type 3 domain-containing protein
VRKRSRVRYAALALLLLTAGSLARPTAALAPSKPRSLRVVGSGQTFVELDWRRVSGADFYRVYRDGNLVAEPERSDHRDDGLEPATTYEYRVSAVDKGAEGPLSDPVEVTTDAPPAPESPTDLVATATAPDRVDLSWSAAASEIEISFYRVQRDGDEIATTATTEYSDTGLEPSTEYEYRVSAIDALGRESAPSDPSSAITLAEPGPPPPRNLLATPTGSSQIDLSWEAPEGSAHPVEGYRVYRGGEQIGLVVTTAFADTGLSPDTEYSYAVASVDDRGIEGEPSEEVSATTDPPADLIPPAPPTGLRQVGD